MSGIAGMFSRRPLESALTAMMDCLKGKFSKRQGATTGRFQLTPKRAPRNFYKGKGALNLGFHTKRGKYIVQQAKIPQLVVPDLVDCELKPYVSYKAAKV